jgi:hypothetical protein
MLETNNYVGCMIDFVTVFNTEDHTLVLRKANMLDIPASIKNWLIDFFTGRSHIAKVFDNSSSRLEINHSIVQGFGIESSLRILMESDLHTLCDSNVYIYSQKQREKRKT